MSRPRAVAALLRIAPCVFLVLTGAARAQTPAAPPQPPAPAAPAQTPPQPSTQVAGRVLTLEECIAIALEAQPRVQATLADYAAARYRVNQAFAPLLPQLSGVASATRSHIPIFVTNAAGNNVPTTQSRDFNESFVAQAQLSQLLFDFGKNLAATDAARKLAEVAVEDVELQRQLISLTVKEAYTNTLFSQRLILVQEQAVELAGLNVRSAKGFFDVGTRPKSDVARAEVDVANARVDLIRARNAEQLARVALATAMGLPATTSLQIQDNLVYQPVTLDRARLADEALRMRPE